jgi:hypothetical protein
MTLITQAQIDQLLANGRAQRNAIDTDQGALDFKPVVKLFTPDAQCTWLLSVLRLAGPFVLLHSPGDGEPGARARLASRPSAVSTSMTSHGNADTSSPKG